MVLFEVLFFSLFIPFLELFDKNKMSNATEDSVLNSFWYKAFDFFDAETTLSSITLCLVLTVIMREAVSMLNQYLQFSLIGAIEKGVQNKVVRHVLEPGNGPCPAA